jgi:hypothetical protein
MNLGERFANFFLFAAWNKSFFGDLHMPGGVGVLFYTNHTTTTTRWFNFGEEDIWGKD